MSRFIPSGIRNARCAEIDCTEHFKHEGNYRLFVEPGPLAAFKHVSDDDVIVTFLGDDNNERALEDSLGVLKGWLDQGASQELVNDLIKAFNDGFVYAILFGD